MKTESKANTWITFIGVVLLLIGVYATVRTAINLKLFDKYPQTGVLVFNFGGQPIYSQREEDCFMPRIYYKVDAQTVRPSTPEEKEQEKRDQKSCLSSVSESRNTAKVNDISQSLLFLFLGIGVLATRKIFFK